MCSKRECFFFNDTATTEIYTLSLRDALPISGYARNLACIDHETQCNSQNGRAHHHFGCFLSRHVKTLYACSGVLYPVDRRDPSAF